MVGTETKRTMSKEAAARIQSATARKTRAEVPKGSFAARAQVSVQNLVVETWKFECVKLEIHPHIAPDNGRCRAGPGPRSRF